MSANHLFDEVINKRHLKNDAALARELEVAPPVISKMRHKRLPVGPSMILGIHERFGMAVSGIRDLIALDE